MTLRDSIRWRWRVSQPALLLALSRLEALVPAPYASLGRNSCVYSTSTL
jgi:hypothetical protein